jgi:hypothetical protein
LPSYSTERVNTTARCRFSRSDFGERKRREDEKLKKKKRLSDFKGVPRSDEMLNVRSVDPSNKTNS